MATYKAEFLSHYYQRKRRPREAYAFGWINRWAQLAALAPRSVNWLAQAPGFSSLMKTVAGMSPQRRIPQFAPETFRHWFKQRAPRNHDKPPVILWPDTFNNHFHPETAKAAVAALEAAGFQVRIPDQHICCGCPLYDFGMLDQAKRQLQRILTDMRPAIDSGIRVVGLEPACVAVFRDEMVNLFPNDESAQKLHRQTYFFSEFLLKKAPDFRFPKLERKAMLHGHCHQKAIIKIDDEQNFLKDFGLDLQYLDSGCCGMAGSFGFEKDKYEVSCQTGELALLPAVRAASPDTLIVADGYSCREQIAQMTARRSLHSAEVMLMALQNESAR
ncbi:MAG: heterodisulfide reductase-related iron-sulfur binding cluster [Methylococcales bacterium]|nr:heterodisulfide reductase-related iron-sulfur binding cluster [Methylococcales bacterium]